MDLLRNAANTSSYLGAAEFIRNIEALKVLGGAPSETFKCCATGTCT